MYKFDRKNIKFKSLSERYNKVDISKDYVKLDTKANISEVNIKTIKDLACKIKNAREHDRQVMLTFGAHSIKNGLSNIMIELIKNKMLTHLATNGAGIIHDWEFSFLGKSSEDVKANVAKGEFGIWEETGHFLNLAILKGASENLGYGESVGKFISEEEIYLKTDEEIMKEIKDTIDTNPDHAASLLDLMSKLRELNIKRGLQKVEHNFKKYSIQRESYELKVPFTAHPMFGHDIIYTHPMNTGAAIGRAAERDFLSFVDSISKLKNGIYISIGSAVMSPMIFEKALSMARNVAINNGDNIDNVLIYIVDLAENNWDWSKGEPSDKDPEYYLRYMKTFSRMGSNVQYIQANNTDFLLCLYQELLSKN